MGLPAGNWRVRGGGKVLTLCEHRPKRIRYGLHDTSDPSLETIEIHCEPGLDEDDILRLANLLPTRG